jgi:uncharacterized membrane protein YhfC
VDEKYAPEQYAEVRGNPELDAYALLKKLVEDAIGSGQVQKAHKDAELLTQTIWAGVHGVAALQIAMKTDSWIQWRSLKQRTNAMLDALSYGIFVEKN